MREAVEIATKFLELLTTIEKSYDTLYAEVGKIDKETSDLLHDLEFDIFCGREGYKKAKRIKEIRMRRRELKNTMELVNPLREYSKIHSKIKIDLYKVITQMGTIAKDQSERVYVPRVRNDLKIANQHFSTGEQ
jgi:hypothetical protein